MLARAHRRTRRRRGRTRCSSISTRRAASPRSSISGSPAIGMPAHIALRRRSAARGDCRRTARRTAPPGPRSTSRPRSSIVAVGADFLDCGARPSRSSSRSPTRARSSPMRRASCTSARVARSPASTPTSGSRASREASSRSCNALAGQGRSIADGRDGERRRRRRCSQRLADELARHEAEPRALAACTTRERARRRARRERAEPGRGQRRRHDQAGRSARRASIGSGRLTSCATPSSAWRAAASRSRCSAA